MQSLSSSGSSGVMRGTTIPLLEQVVNFAEARHNVLAGDIANFDTPGFKVRDLSREKFQARLRDALSQRSHSSGDLYAGVSAADRSLEHASQNLEGILYHDDSTGSIEGLVSEVSKNQIEHNLALAIMGSQFRLLQAAVSEHV